MWEYTRWTNFYLRRWQSPSNLFTICGVTDDDDRCDASNLCGVSSKSCARAYTTILCKTLKKRKSSSIFRRLTLRIFCRGREGERERERERGGKGERNMRFRIAKCCILIEQTKLCQLWGHLFKHYTGELLNPRKMCNFYEFSIKRIMSRETVWENNNVIIISNLDFSIFLEGLVCSVNIVFDITLRRVYT